MVIFWLNLCNSIFGFGWKLINLLVDVEEESAQFLESLDQLEIGTWLIPGVGRDGVNDGVATTATIRNLGEVVWHLFNIGLESLERLVALMLFIVGVLLETEEQAFVEWPVVAIIHGVGSNSSDCGDD